MYVCMQAAAGRRVMRWLCGGALALQRLGVGVRGISGTLWQPRRLGLGRRAWLSDAGSGGPPAFRH